MKHPLYLTPAEFEIMEHLWQSREFLTVSQVLERIKRKRSVAYTTIMTLLDKMARKGSVRRRKRGKAYVYTAAVDRREVQAHLLQRFASSYFGGEVERIAGFLASSRRPKLRPVRSEPAPSRPQPSASVQARPDASDPELDVSLL